jgi:hypothetical protein
LLYQTLRWPGIDRGRGTLARIFGRAKGGTPLTTDDERPCDVSADLPYELQSKMLDQLTTVSVAGAGLAITLIGSLLQHAPRQVWISVVLFGLAALTAVGGNIRLIEGTFQRHPVLCRSKRDVSITMALIGAAAGFLSMDIYAETNRAAQVAQAQRAAAPRIAPGTR